MDLRIDLPVLLDITEPIVIETDKTEEPEGIADEDSTSGIRFQEATLTYQLASTSGLPVRARFLVARDSANVFTAPDLEFVLNVTAAVDTTIVLTRAQWEILMGPVWTAAKVTIPTTTQPVMVRKNDRIWAKAFVTARVLIDPDAGNGGGGGR